MLRNAKQTRAKLPPHCLVCGMSRSGTTLLVTMLDSHPEISMGYEMLPAGIEDLSAAAKSIEHALHHVTKAKEVEQWLIENGAQSLSKYVEQADRAAVPPSELPAILRTVDQELVDRSPLSVRYALSEATVEHKRQDEHARICGFKLNAPSVAAFDSFAAEDTRYIFVLRDPRDIYASHKANDFNRDIEHVTRAWIQYLDRFIAFSSNAPNRTMIVRYEDVVQDIDEYIKSIGVFLELDDPSPMRNFFESKASVHKAGHINSVALKRDVFKTSIGRWTRDLERNEIENIESTCADSMLRHGYTPSAAEIS